MKPRRRSNSIPWCTSFHVILSLRTWHIMISILQHARNEHRSAPGGWFPASAFENIELAYIYCALKENFCDTLKGFRCMCFTDLSRTTCAQLNTKYKTRQLIRFTRRVETITNLKGGSDEKSRYPVKLTTKGGLQHRPQRSSVYNGS